MDVPGSNGLKWEPRKPELRYPSMFAAWPGMGSVALTAAQYLVEKLQMKPLGHIDASTYVLADGILVQNQKILPLRLPEYRFHLASNESDRQFVLSSRADSAVAQKARRARQ